VTGVPTEEGEKASTEEGEQASTAHEPTPSADEIAIEDPATTTEAEVKE
jgi:hypothetical protein